MRIKLLLGCIIFKQQFCIYKVVVENEILVFFEIKIYQEKQINLILSVVEGMFLSMCFRLCILSGQKFSFFDNEFFV